MSPNNISCTNVHFPSMKSKYLMLGFLIVILTIVSGGIVGAVGSPPAVDPSMVLYYHFNNQSAYGENDTRVFDFSGNDNNGTMINVTINNTGSYLNDGVGLFKNGSYITVNKSVVNYNLSTGSIAMWFKTPNAYTTSTNRGVLGFYSGTASRFALGFMLSYDGILKAHCNDNSSNLGFRNSGYLSNNTWYHAVVTYTPGSCTLYINGVSLGSSTVAVGYLPTQNRTFEIGRMTGYNQQYYGFNENYENSSIDEVIVYNKTLSTYEVGNLYNDYYGCYTPTDGLTFGGYYNKLCKGTYNLNGSTSGALILGTSGGTLDCNGSTIYGNYSSGSGSYVGIMSNGISNISIINCSISNYYYGISLSNSNGNISFNNFSLNRMSIYLNSFSNSTISNNLFGNASYGGIWFYNPGSAHNTFIINNTFKNTSSGLMVESTSSYPINLKVYNNYFETSLAILQNNGSYWDINNNIIHGANTLFSGNIVIGGNHNLIRNNWMDNSQYNIWVKNSSSNIPFNNTILNNTIVNGDQGSTLGFNGGNFVYFINNTILNMTSPAMDGYGVGLKVFGMKNAYIIGNNFSFISTVGILLQETTNVTIRNNYFDFIPLNQRRYYGSKDTGVNELRCAIQSTMRYKGWYNTFGNYNLTIFNNTFDSDTPCYLHLENQTILNNDLTNYWYSSFNPQVMYNGLNEFYIPNYYNNISGWNGSLVFYDFYSSFYTSTRTFLIQYNISKDVKYYKNMNKSAINLTNLIVNNSLCFLSNNSLCGSSDISQNNGQINITLQPGNYSYIYDNYVLIEGSPKDGEPLAIVNVGTTKHITSTLAEDVIVPVVVNAQDCSTINRITYTTDSGIKTVYSGSDARALCSGGQVTLDNVLVEPSLSSNLLEIEYGTTSLQSVVLRLLIGFIALLVCMGSIAMLYYRLKVMGAKVTIQEIVVYFVVMLVAVILANVLINYVVGVS